MSAGVAINPGQGWQLPRRLVYVVSHALPWSTNGYAIRTDGVARALQALGHEVIVVTRPGRPWDIAGFTSAAPVPLDHKIHGLRHICLPLDPLPGARPVQRVSAMADELTAMLRVFRPAAVLGASNWETAEAARRAAGRVGAAFIYEQRGFWAMDPVAETAAERDERARETEIALGARLVLTLGSAMRAELIRRGVPPGRIALMPNGLDPLPAMTRPVQRADLGITAARVLGYIGSLNDYEGLDDLLHAVAQLRRGDGGAQADVAALIVGADAPKGLVNGPTGPVLAGLRQLARQLGIADHVHFVPQLPAAEAAAHYGLCDVMVLPRRRNRMTELVPPLKPFAAAAHGVPLVMSDLPPLAEAAVATGARLYPAGDRAGLVAALVAELALAPRLLPVPAGLDWQSRVAPLATELAGIAQTALADNARRFAGLAVAPPPGGATGVFDLANLPRVGLAGMGTGAAAVVRIGPGAAVAGPWLVRPRRGTLLEVLATMAPGRFIIDWAGLQAAAGADAGAGDATAAGGDWAGLWGTDDMRLNRLIMDAVRIARQRGWRVQVIGPVDRAAAPLYRTIAGVAEEIAADGSPLAAESRIAEPRTAEVAS